MSARLGVVVLVATAGCLGDVEVPPLPPTLQPVTSPTPIPSVTISGTKEVGTAVLEDGAILVPHDDEETWSAQIDLVPGDNTIVLTAQRKSGLASRSATEERIVFEPPCPTSPALDPVTSPTSVAAQVIRGTKPGATSLWLDDVQIVALDDATTWMHTLTVPPTNGAHDFTLVAKDYKDQQSDPIRFTVVYDTTQPTIVARYPEDVSDGAPLNTSLWITFDGALDITGTEPPEGMVTLTRNGQSVPFSAVYHPITASIQLFPNQTLEANAAYTVAFDPAKVRDRAGNAANPTTGDWSWTFTTGDADDLVPPVAPTIDAPPSTVRDATVTLSGTKGAWTAIDLGGDQIYPMTAETTWSHTLPLPVGSSTVAIAARSVSGVVTDGDTITIERTIDRPAPPTLAADTPTQVVSPNVSLAGTKPTETSLVVNDQTVVCRNADTSWAYLASLNPGQNDLKIQSKNAEGITSDPILHTVAYERTYEGLVPDGFKLQVSFGLRDLSQVSGIRQEFSDGPNFYGVDVWVEGPLEPGETCSFERGERQDVKYVATLEHYVGKKAQHTVPFADEDYRGTDYIASLITGNVLSFLGLDASSPRRAPNGKEVAGLLAGISETDLRENIDCVGSPIVDTCTSATSNAGLKTVSAWTPRRRNGRGLLEQGDYLLWIQINLDRNPGWLDANDYETCWGDLAFANVGMHRVVRKIALGSEPYVETVPQSEEHFGPDVEGSGRLHFIDDRGVTIQWGPR